MFKPYNNISACLRPSARLKVWEQRNVAYWLPRPGPSFTAFQLGDEALLQVFTKDWKKLYEAFLAAKQYCVYGQCQSSLHFPTGTSHLCRPLPQCRPCWAQGSAGSHLARLHSSRAALSLAPARCANVPSILLLPQERVISLTLPFSSLFWHYPFPRSWILQLPAPKLSNLCIRVKSSCELLPTHNSSSNSQRSPPTSTAEPAEIHNRWLWQKHIFYFVPSVHQKASVPVPLIPTIKPCMTY